MSPADELSARIRRVRRHLVVNGLKGALLATHANFAWITGGGRSHVSITTERAVAGVLVTADRVLLLADNIERRRLEEEELTGLDLDVRKFSWWSGSIAVEALKLVPAESLVADIPVPGARTLSPADGIRLRNPLLAPEIARYRKLGADVAVVLTHVAFHCRPALSEHQLAGMLGQGLMDFGITPAVTLAAADERVFSRRHPLPTDRRLETYAMLAVGGRRHGLNVSATRLVHFGPVPEELRRKQEACARVDAAFLAATRPGAALADVFRTGQAAYAAEGCPDEWQRHHQGGPTGYNGRDLRAGPGSPTRVMECQAFAWNPTIAGTKSEDTVIVTEHGVEVLSRTPDLPEVEVEAEGRRFVRAAILER